MEELSKRQQIELLVTSLEARDRALRYLTGLTGTPTPIEESQIALISAVCSIGIVLTHHLRIDPSELEERE